MPARSRQRMWTVFALAAGVAWLWHQEAGRRQLSAEVEGLRSRLDARDEPAPRPQDGSPEALTGLERQPIDWQAIAAKLKSGGEIAGGLLNKNARLLAALEAKSVEELLAMLSQIAVADLSKRERDVLERVIAKILAGKAPDVALSRFSVPDRSDWSFFLGGLYQQWVKQDSVAAIAWLRKHMESGGYFHSEMVSISFFGLLESAAGTSAEVLESVPPEDRLESLRCQSAAILAGSGQKEWAEIVRKVIPETDRAEAISWPLANWSDGDGAPMRLDEVDTYLELIGASKAEWDACIMAVAATNRSWVTTAQVRQVEYADETKGFQQMREWVSKHSPGMLEAATLRGLEELAREGDLKVASERALEFHKASGNDAYLCRVLDRANDLTDATDIRVMIERLSDPELQAKYRKEKASILKAK